MEIKKTTVQRVLAKPHGGRYTKGMGLLLVAGFVALIIAGIVWSSYVAEKRRQALAAWAAAHGLTFAPGNQPSFEQQYPGLSALQRGENRYAYNIVTGKWENYEILTFDYHYETHSTDSKGNREIQHHHFSGVLARCPVPFRPLLIRPENFFDKIGAAVGFDDIDFESAEFSRKFYVKSPDKRWAYDVIHQRTMEFLLEQNPGGVIEFTSSHGSMVAASTSAPEELEFALRVVIGIFDRLPDYVRQRQAENP